MKRNAFIPSLFLLSLGLLPAIQSSAKAISAQAKKSIVTLKEERPGLAKMATVTLEKARAVAMAKVAKGRIQAQEIEEENGRLIYSFDVKVKGNSGIEEVNVDAKTGELVNTEHEGAKAEAKEQVVDKAEAKADAVESKKKEEKREKAAK